VFVESDGMMAGSLLPPGELAPSITVAVLRGV